MLVGREVLLFGVELLVAGVWKRSDGEHHDSQFVSYRVLPILYSFEFQNRQRCHQVIAYF